MAYFPNVAAAQHFHAHIYPALKARRPGITLQLVGRNPHPSLLEIERHDPSVTVTGYVPDAAAHIVKSAVVIVPLLHGSGTRLKILEAWAVDRPVVSTSKGCEGIDCRDGHDLIVADTPDAFVDGVCRLLDDREFAARLTRQARQTLLARYDVAIDRRSHCWPPWRICRWRPKEETVRARWRPEGVALAVVVAGARRPADAAVGGRAAGGRRTSPPPITSSTRSASTSTSTTTAPPYKDQFDLIKSRLLELGVRHVRDGLIDTEWQGYYDRHNELGDAGIKGTFITSFGQSLELLAAYPSRVRRSFEAYEAPNEADKSGDPQWVSKLRQAIFRLGRPVAASPRWRTTRFSARRSPRQAPMRWSAT